MKYYDVIVIGSGCAGYNAADRLYRSGVKNIAVLTEGRNLGTSRNTGSDMQTYYKLSLCGSEGDSVRELAGTLYSGGGVMGEHALCEAAYSTRCFMRLVELGVPFPSNEYGEYAGYKTDHDPRTRATSAGPLTSKYMTEALEKAVGDNGTEIMDGLLATRILTDGDGVTGVAAVSVKSGDTVVIPCGSVILCTGGPAGIYRDTVYPASQHGAYGIASTDFRWNLSGTYQQVIPRYFSVGDDGEEREFLYDALGDASLGLIFLKGYQWPFDTNKAEGSSKIDLLVADQIKRGRRVYLDFTVDPKGLENGFSVLPAEAKDYLQRSGALCGTPIKRLQIMNPAAIDLYASHGIDLYREPLRIAVCAQHCNGGAAVDGNWQTCVKGLYAAGEAAGTFGVYRPGGSALNSTQVGSLRAAEHIAATRRVSASKPRYDAPVIRYGESNLNDIGARLRAEMSRVADFDRSLSGMKRLFDEVSALCLDFFSVAVISDKTENADLFRLYDSVITARSVLSAMILSAEEKGSHGSAFVDRMPPDPLKNKENTRTVTRGAVSHTEPVSGLPDPELWFETLLKRKLNKNK